MGQIADPLAGLPADHRAVPCTPAAGTRTRTREAYVYAEDDRVVVLIPPGESGAFTVEGARTFARAVDRYATAVAIATDPARRLHAVPDTA